MRIFVPLVVLYLSSVCWGQANVQALGKVDPSYVRDVQVVLAELGQDSLQWRYILVSSVQYDQIKRQFGVTPELAFTHLPTRTTYVSVRAIESGHYIRDIAHELGHILTDPIHESSESKADFRARELIKHRQVVLMGNR